MDEEKKELIEVKKVNNTEEKTQQTKKVEEPKKDRKGFCIASMVLGIIALVLFCVFYISIPCAIVAIIFGILGLKSTERGMAIAGLVTGSIGLFISIAIIVIVFIAGVAAGISDTLNGNYNSTGNYRNYELYD